MLERSDTRLAAPIDELNELTTLVRRWSEARAALFMTPRQLTSEAALCMAESALENWLKDHLNAA